MFYNHERIDEDTGEVMETYTLPYKHPDVIYKDVYDRTKMTCKNDVISFFSEEIYNPTVKIRYTNWAVDELFNIEYSLAYKFKLLSEYIISRNIVFEQSKDLCGILGIHKTDLSKVLKKMQEKGLVKEMKDHSGKLGWRYLELNPTIVFKTYQHNDTEQNYSSSFRFNSLHQFYIDKWINSYIGKTS